MTQRKVTEIPATIRKFTAMPINGLQKRRVAGYARVSTDHEEQATSYEAQVEYYTNYINSRSDWEFVGIYTDEGISATNTKKREGFKSMVADALAGKIDLIVTKSVSRFARNTVDSLTTVRQLKAAGIEIYFEKENIWTMDSKGELLITIMSSLAQEESRSISENVTWGYRKRFADGKVSFVYDHFLGLDKDKETGKLVVNPKQAETVRLIFRLFLQGFSQNKIATELTRRGIKTPMGKDVWSSVTVRAILMNEKYKGDALLQKYYTVDFLQKKKKRNNGEIPQYYVEGNHEAIINPAAFDLVQAELEKRKADGLNYSGRTIFCNKIKCGDCGGWYGSKVWHSTDKYRKIVYRCNKKYKGEKCKTPFVTEDEIKAAFVAAYNKMLNEKAEIIANLETMRKTLTATKDLVEEKARLNDEMEVLARMVEKIVDENARVAQNQSDYQKRYNELVEKHEEARGRYEKVEQEIKARELQNSRLKFFISFLKKQEAIIQDFDETLWGCMVDHVTVYQGKKITITFRDGTEVEG